MSEMSKFELALPPNEIDYDAFIILWVSVPQWRIGSMVARRM